MHGSRTGFLRRLRAANLRFQSLRTHGHGKDGQVNTPHKNKIELTVFIFSSFLCTLLGTGPASPFHTEQTTSTRYARSARHRWRGIPDSSNWFSKITLIRLIYFRVFFYIILIFSYVMLCGYKNMWRKTKTTLNLCYYIGDVGFHSYLCGKKKKTINLTNIFVYVIN